VKHRTFGRLGWSVSDIGFGAWAIGSGWGPQSDVDSVAALHRAFDLGCNFVDTAQGYGDGRSERVIADAIKSWAGRERVYVATKIPPSPGAWPPSAYDKVEERFSATYLRERLERSLRDLGTDCIDVVQLHTWSRSWNENPEPFRVLREMQREGKLRAVGISTPETDQNSVIDLMKGGWVDSVQVIYNVFNQEAQAEIFPVARQTGTAMIVRVAFDEGSLTGKLTRDTKFAKDDMRNRYFAGDRLGRTVARVEAISATVGTREANLATAALKFAMKPAAVSTVIPGIRNVDQATANLTVSDESPLDDDLEQRLRAHEWRRGFWYSGK
jgi:aryl-alcohol dehydrogenase-like predicted oxidoreductase